MSTNAEQILNRVEWTLLKRLDGLLQGDYRTLYRGFGIDLADLREYQYHDDVRHIDWNVTARLNVPHVRQFIEDRDLTAWFLVDMTASMAFGSDKKRKSEVLLENIVLLARLLTKHGNRMGALLYYGNSAQGKPLVRSLPAGRGRAHVLTLIDELTKTTATKGTHTDLRSFFAQAGAAIKRRSLVFIASDFIDATEGAAWSAPLGQLAMRHEVIALHSQDALEQTMPDIGLVVMQDAETGEQLVVDTHDKGFRARFEALSREQQEQLELTLRRANVDRLAVGDAQALVAFTLARKWRKRRAA
jgi:uncharacterized protein (DUF58 family)